jgi:iron(III) transport system ATP-binding protein
MMDLNKILEIDDMSFSYSEEDKILENFSIDVNEGEFVTVLGDSGVGKTTLFRAINGLEKISSGYIRLEGNLLSSAFYHIPAEKRPIGTIFQDYALFPHLNVEKNIFYGLKKKNYDKHFVKEVLGLLRVEGFLNRYIDQLSGGQKQRVSLARALVRKPKLLLMDEPFSNLDKNLRLQIRRELKKNLIEIGSTVLLITHDSEEALSLSDKIGYLYKGKIIQFDSPYELFHNPNHRIIATSISNSNVIKGDVLSGKAKTKIGDFILPKNCKNQGGAYINVRSNQIKLNRSSRNFEIIQEEFLEGKELYILKDIKDGQTINVSMDSSSKFLVGEKVGIEIINNKSNIIDIS